MHAVRPACRFPSHPRFPLQLSLDVPPFPLRPSLRRAALLSAVVLSVLVVAHCKTMWHQLDGYTFDHYKAEFGRAYEGVEVIYDDLCFYLWGIGGERERLGGRVARYPNLSCRRSTWYLLLASGRRYFRVFAETYDYSMPPASRCSTRTCTRSGRTMPKSPLGRWAGASPSLLRAAR